jgi:hypothetical protein
MRQVSSPTRTTTKSEIFKTCAGLMRCSLSVTRPASIACCARLRVLKKRAAQSHLSTRMDPGQGRI